MEKIRWGILSTAKIGLTQVIPAMQLGEFSEVIAISSRSLDKAEVAASSLGLERAYGSYEALLEDPDVDAIYNPLPNNMHLEWTVKAMEAGKHVLCEKPIALSVKEVEQMIEVRDRFGVKAGEAFMVKSYPQWIESRERVRRGEVGELRLVQGTFSYFNADPANIRNIAALGGGGIWDIGCYPVTLSRYLYEQEPVRLVAALEFDPEMKTDRLSSVIMEFPSGQAIFAVSTQLVPYQRMHMFGTKGHLEVHIPFNAPSDRSCTVAQDRGSILLDEITTHSYPESNQYTLMGDAFSKAILEDAEVPVTLEDALNNTKVLTAIFESAKRGSWVEI
ncbi:MAG: Gfo/Idh/MocA family oxidoreductase [Bacteroidales bacterium]|nr:Gfo/Idh/MocA family oxidoreductase [Bacteroidales bacterium]